MHAHMHTRTDLVLLLTRRRWRNADERQKSDRGPVPTKLQKLVKRVGSYARQLSSYTAENTAITREKACRSTVLIFSQVGSVAATINACPAAGFRNRDGGEHGVVTHCSRGRCVLTARGASLAGESGTMAGTRDGVGLGRVGRTEEGEAVTSVTNGPSDPNHQSAMRPLF